MRSALLRLHCWLGDRYIHAPYDSRREGFFQHASRAVYALAKRFGHRPRVW